MLVEAYIYMRAINQETYQEQYDKLIEAKALAEVDLNGIHLDEFDVAAVLNFAEHMILNAAHSWSEFSLVQKQRFQKVLFPQGIHF